MNKKLLLFFIFCMPFISPENTPNPLEPAEVFVEPTLLPEDCLVDRNGEIVNQKFSYAKELKLINHYIKPLSIIAKSKHASKFMGWAQNNITPFSIDWRKFAIKHNINLDECVIPEAGFKTFNEFFTRKLKPGARVIDQTNGGVVSPADSKITYVENVSKKDIFIIKSSQWSLTKMLKNQVLADLYEGGTLISFRLAPEDYHRFHFPFDSTPGFSKKIPGRYDSVNPFVYKHGYDPLGENARNILILKSEEFDDPICIIVGALGVGKIIETYSPYVEYKKGDEMGYFEFGASTICLLFKKNIIKPAEGKFISNSIKMIETEVKQGSLIALHKSINHEESPLEKIQVFLYEKYAQLKSFFNKK
ncbi:phosphatidylserine decarboxylase [Candidatus Dependentiae bacterium]|nr:phosphatidylserine decarboxylase [Candidatus Dependentiae bacterium]